METRKLMENNVKVTILKRFSGKADKSSFLAKLFLRHEGRSYAKYITELSHLDRRHFKDAASENINIRCRFFFIFLI